MFLVPMDTAGITVRPIRSMLGPHHLNEVFFDDVWAGPEAVLGEVGEGWAVIRRALAHERVGIARYARCERLLSALGRELAPVWDELPPAIPAQWARALIQVRVARLLAYRTVRAQETGEPPDVLASAARIAVTQCDQSVAELLFQAVEERQPGVGRGGAAPRRDRGPLALRAGRHRGLGHHRGPADDRLQGAARRSVVNPVLPDAAAEFGATAAKAFAALGGVDAARRAEESPDAALGEVAKALEALGIGEIDPRLDDDNLAAAAALCVEAGRVALPYPVVPVLLRGDDRPFAVVPDDRARVDHGDLFDSWRIATLDGRTRTAAPAGEVLGSRLGPFVADLAPSGDATDGSTSTVALHLTLTAWLVLGTSERAVELAVDHVTTRIQFGKPLSAFQAVQFQLADAAVAVAGLRELAHFTLWRIAVACDAAMVDALALPRARHRRGPVGAAGVPAAPRRRGRVRRVRHLGAGPARAAVAPAAVQRRAGRRRAGHRHRPPRLRGPVPPRPGGAMTTLAGPSLDGFPGIGALTMGGFLEEVGERFAADEALVFDDPLRDGATQRWTYARLLDEARAVAQRLVAEGVVPGERVAILMGNRPEAVAALFGAALAGAVAVPLSTFAPRPELAFMLEHAEVVVALTQERMLGRRYGDDLRALQPALPHLRAITVIGEESPTSDDPTSNPRHRSTRPRPSVASCGGVAAGPARGPRADHLQLGDDQRAEGDAPLPPGADAAVLGAGADLPARRDHADVDRPPDVLDGRAQHGHGLDAGRRGVLGDAGVVRTGRGAGPHGPRAGHRALRPPPPGQRAGRAPGLGHHRPVVVPVRLREVGAGAPSHRHGRHQLEHARRLRPVGDVRLLLLALVGHARELLKRSMGRLLPGNELRVVDPDTGKVLGPNEDGELAIKGPTLMEHYVGKTPDECFDADGFLHTGDAGWFDDEGYIHFTGRRTEMIKTGGANVSPAELEVELRAYPPVKLARIIGMPDPRLDQLVVACITLKDGAECTEADLQAFLRERVAAYKVPKRVLFFADGEIPMTSSDTKVRDADLAALVAERLSRDPVPTSSSGER